MESDDPTASLRNFSPMKSLLRLCVVFLWLTGPGLTLALAQSVDVRAGINMATVTGEPRYTFMPAYYLGLAKDLSISKHVSFRPEVYYSLQGAHRDEERLWLHYVQMPLFFNFDVSEKVGIAWGPQIGLMTRANLRNDARETYPALVVMNKFEVEVGGGPYYKINERLRVELRVLIGVTEYHHDDGLRNLVLQGGVAWSINKLPSE